MDVQSISKQTSKQASRILWVDVVKGTLIILMVFGHNIQFGSGKEMIENQIYFDNPVFRFIYSFHMPCLMLISGYFFGFSVDRQKIWKRRIENILIPTIAWSIIPVGSVFFKATLNRQMDIKVFVSCASILILYYWFIWAILFGSLTVWLVHKFLKDSIIAYVAIGAWLLFVPKFLNTELWIFMYPYFVVGYLWNIKKVQFEWIVKHKIVTAAILVAAFIVLFAFYNKDSFIYTTGITVRCLKQLGIDLCRYAIGFVGSAMVIWIVYILYPLVKSKARWVNKGLTYCGQVSLSIYIVDCLLNSYVLPRLTKGFTLNYGTVLIETVTVLLFCIGVDWLIKKIPIARKVLLGNR